MEFKQQQAIYRQIADYICEKILGKEWGVDEKILSIRDFGRISSVLLSSLNSVLGLMILFK